MESEQSLESLGFMESTYLYYPVQKVFKILSTSKLTRKGYKVVFSDSKENSVILLKQALIFKKKFFEIKISTAEKETVSRITVNRLNTEDKKNPGEKELIEEILHIF